MQAEEDYEALGDKAKEGDADAIEEWLSSLERDPNSQALLLSPGDRNKIAKVLCSACASSRPGCVRVARLILESLTVVSVEGLEPAVLESDQSQVERLLGNCLLDASQYGAEETVEAILNCRVQLLTSCRADVNYDFKGFTALGRHRRRLRRRPGRRGLHRGPVSGLPRGLACGLARGLSSRLDGDAASLELIVDRLEDVHRPLQSRPRRRHRLYLRARLPDEARARSLMLKQHLLAVAALA